MWCVGLRVSDVVEFNMRCVKIHRACRSLLEGVLNRSLGFRVSGIYPQNHPVPCRLHKTITMFRDPLNPKV